MDPLTTGDEGVILYAKIPDSWYTNAALLATYVDTHTYIILLKSTEVAGGIGGAFTGVSTGFAME